MEEKQTQNKRYDAVLFDLDGTLSDSLQHILETRKILLENHGIHMTIEQIKESHTSTVFIDELSSNFGKKLTDEEFYALDQELIEIEKQTHEDYVKLFPGVREVLEELSQNDIRMGIVTNRIGDSTNKHIVQLQIDKYFEVVASFDTASNPKPHPDHINYALKKMKLRGEQWNEKREARILYVGDAEIDIQAAEQAKCDFALVPYAGFKPTDEIKKRIKHNLENIKDLVQIALEGAN
ncbi:MAG: putative pyrophosphatase PpaX [Streblomastix strix]|uniref:Putative pyrophosphatase PpaX n=1 Tax=Streblomastix strix TaxID=222440 RepID=A0A5J4UTB8_9EUKA|nr:MAG: putative pyrophosphatase PpaX [Streblomastix strix]